MTEAGRRERTVRPSGARALVWSTARRVIVPLVAVGGCLAVAGCANTDVEFKGTLFEYAGLTDLGKKQPEAKVPARAGLVLPPDPNRLPQPGSAPLETASINNDAWPVDPEDARTSKDIAAREAHARFCEKARRDARTMGKITVEDGPLGSCEESILKSLAGKDAVTHKGGGSKFDVTTGRITNTAPAPR